MRKFGLIGYPLGHSFSKRYFTEKFDNEDISDCSYDNFPIRSIEQLPDLINSVPELEGLNVTIPYKSSVISYLNHIDREASEIGAVNVLKLKRRRIKAKVFGYNSDVNGIRDSLCHVLKHIRQAMVMGTGGSAKTVCYVLEKAGIMVIRVSRTRKPGVISYNDIKPDLIKVTDLIVNTTPLGMFPDTGSKPDFCYDCLDKRHIMFDLVYNPEITAFLKEGQERGCNVITGLKMLRSQAERSWEIWNSADY